ncbi:hypothetical protein G917_01310 [Escherichia coli UMEA 3148-1]|jgi:hypothetical protein|uniref:DUF1627 domain-containing protein n=2 Tax=Escherichia coli TaxID=562 RepID=UPI0002A2CB7C|nr:DUF1627 domain-containing protein [Escherichia coli]ELE99824.1 hypothetical protein A1WY_01877 [Escherichia coli KTE111]DAL10670.1 MAG TPA_asm: Protein of unknown function (DUF1627) [Caudoviricetes sp.]EJP6682729.1 DUF1627 domain-containing protein [Escherichia coli]EQX85744.1 hypothetical protein G937_01310 [Escherichia coli UMEA 3199-1]ESP47522.1 hypothetical protein G917_01310 [Escherichia coli UMEA 3148-1]
METVIQALEKMGRATYREVAARLDIEPVEALNMLREQREQGMCDFSDGGWFVGRLKDQKNTPAPAPAVAAKAPLRGEEPKEISVEGITRLLAQRGAMDTVGIAREFGRNARGITAWMGSLARQGVVVKNGQGRGVTWSLPAPAAPAAGPAPAAEAVSVEHELTKAGPEKDIAQIVSEIPAFTEGCAASMSIPAARMISREIRRTKNRLAQLTKLQGAVRTFARHKNLVQQLVNQEATSERD